MRNNKIIVKKNYGLVPLTQDKFAIIDIEDIEKVKDYYWIFYKDRNTYYAKTTINNKRISMHRLILCLTDVKILTDHKNNNGLDNRKFNLRTCNKSQNGMNRLKQNGSSKFKGVFFHKQTKCWKSQIQVNKRRFSLGYYKIESDAAKAYDDAALKHFCEFAKTNKMLGLFNEN